MGARAQAIATIRLEEPHVRVTEYRFSPEAETGWHRHGHDYVIVPLRRAGVEHNVINANAFEFIFLEIELLR